jgi:glycosyltransferase involved in cell wall biosynthesis
VKKLIRQTKASHLLIEHPYFGWLAVLLKRFTGVKLVVRSHNIEGNRFRTIGKWWWKILWLYEKWTHKHADHNFFITEEDLSYAVQKFKLDASKCLVITYGTTIDRLPSDTERSNAKRSIKQENGITGNEKILFFNGSFNYQPNIDALEILANKICPFLDRSGFAYKLIVCGPWLKKEYHHPNLVIKGYVESIEPYFLAADVFLNPLTGGGGIKTKLVEAIAMNANAVSTTSGAGGVDPALCNGKLALVKDGDWEAFTTKIIEQSKVPSNTPPDFYNHFYWGDIVKKAAAFID